MIRRIVFALLIIGNLTLGTLYLKAESRREFWLNAYLQQLSLRNESRVSTDLLCSVNYTLEKELSLQTRWKGFWEQQMQEICK